MDLPFKSDDNPFDSENHNALHLYTLISRTVSDITDAAREVIQEFSNEDLALSKLSMEYFREHLIAYLEKWPKELRKEFFKLFNNEEMEVLMCNITSKESA